MCFLKMYAYEYCPHFANGLTFAVAFENQCNETILSSHTFLNILSNDGRESLTAIVEIIRWASTDLDDRVTPNKEYE